MTVNDQVQTQGTYNPKKDLRVRCWGRRGREGWGKDRGGEGAGEVSADCLDGCEERNEFVLNPW